jgi:capsule polysaccharide export protein KpsC/LpsZ
LIQHSSTIIIASCGTAITLCKIFNLQKYHHNIDCWLNYEDTFKFWILFIKNIFGDGKNHGFKLGHATLNHAAAI